MPRISILAPGTQVRVPSMDITGTITRAVMGLGANPLVYDVEWTENGRPRKGRWPDAGVEEVNPSPIAANNRATQLGELGKLIADLQQGSKPP